MTAATNNKAAGVPMFDRIRALQRERRDPVADLKYRARWGVKMAVALLVASWVVEAVQAARSTENSVYSERQ